MAGCSACARLATADDRVAGLLVRGHHAFAFLVERPYNRGHVAVCPNRHVAGLHELDEPELVELAALGRRTVEAATRALPAEAFNLGLNEGVAAPEAERDHLRLHVVPRSVNDHGVIAVLGHTRVIPEALDATYAALRQAF